MFFQFFPKMHQSQEGRQFRDPRTQTGKRIRNRIGGYSSWNSRDDRDGRSRQEMRNPTVKDFLSGDSFIDDIDPVCRVADEPAPQGGEIFCPETRVRLIYAQDGSLVSASAV